MNFYRAGIVLASFLLAVNPSAWAVQHIIPGAYRNARQDQMHRFSAAQVRASGSLRAATIASASGIKNVAVIIVQFPASSAANAGLLSGSHSIISLPNINGFFTQMASYYTEVSYGKLTLNFKFFGNLGVAQATAMAAGQYTLSNPEEYYGCGDESIGCPGVTVPRQGASGDYLTRDALLAARGADPTLTSATYDAVIVVHAGNGNETTQNHNGDIWSIFYADEPGQPVIASGGGGFTEGDVVPETEASVLLCPTLSPLGVMCHEFGHSLGLPDLYNTSAVGGTTVVGKWEIMDAGPYDGCGANPSHHGAWNKYTLGWANYTVAGSRTNAALGYVEPVTGSILKIPVQNASSQEYFLVEYRSPASGALFDRSIPGEGLLVWHIDDAITVSRGINAVAPNVPNSVNIGVPHYGVSIITADGLSISNNNQGVATNAFTNGQNLISPKSDAFSGQPSGVSIVKIAGVGSATASFEVVNLAVTAGQSISKLINFPNPAGKGYAHPRGEGYTTIQFHVGRPATDYQVNIYTLSGELVRKVDKSEIELNTDRSADAKWVYEYAWDLKNGSGQHVAPGVYLVLVRADGQSKSSKVVVIR